MEAAFDTLAYAECLEKGGVNREHARLHAEALRVAFNEGVATKVDLREIRVRLDVIMWAGGIFSVVVVGLLIRLVGA